MEYKIDNSNSKLMKEAKQVENEIFENMKRAKTEEIFNEIVEKDEEYKHIFTHDRNYNIDHELNQMLKQGNYI